MWAVINRHDAIHTGTVATLRRDAIDLFVRKPDDDPDLMLPKAQRDSRWKDAQVKGWRVLKFRMEAI